MAQTTVVILTDDIDGTDIPDGKGRTMSFGVDGTLYEIDLRDENAAAFRNAVQRYVNAGRIVNLDPKKAGRNGYKAKVTPRKPPTKSTPTRADPRSRCRYCGKLGRMMQGTWKDFKDDGTYCPPSPNALHEPFDGASTEEIAPTLTATPGSTHWDPKVVRMWAKSNGVKCPARGRIPDRVVKQFQAAGN